MRYINLRFTYLLTACIKPHTTGGIAMICCEEGQETKRK